MFWASAIFTVALGVWHLRIPARVRYREALGEDGPGRPPLGTIALGPLDYELRRRDLRGITWVMSNAASYVLVSIGLLDLRLAAGPPDPVLRPLVLWIAGWWAVRAVSQDAIDRRPIDLALAGWFWLLAGVHVAAFVTLAP
jgi:hypothetical protein